ncbi:glucuronate isomerase [Polaribacter atrinae]|uniref:Uronate isomerase n=1 Tax=Polaribacter atrinae TaxID=1333662 RepID=A0A176TGC8_9FLAO|nr:glucuronate isomerase [Polaribacter atrinae]OAD46455.1 glucuronate isomerase [Polaribacter atrinae]
MNKNLIHDNFLLHNKFSEALYHDYAAKMPIIDYHNHLSPSEIANDKVFGNITDAWLKGDHYKWRALRAFGINEKYITGNSTDKEKFMNWAKTVPYTLRNPLYHWTHLELARYFNIYELLNEKNGEAIFNETSSLLNTPEFSSRSLLKKMNVEVLCTTEDPLDTLIHHQKIASSNLKTKVSTAFRPDKAITIDDLTYNDYLDKLEEVVGFSISSYDDLCDALKKRITYFKENGCTLSDHGLKYICFENYTETEIKSIFKKKRSRNNITNLESSKFQTSILQFLCEIYSDLGWVQQFHLGALRQNNSRITNLLGADAGCDSIGDYPQVYTLSKFLDSLDCKNKLTKTIIYNLNPADNESFATMVGNFNDGSIKGKIQFGSGWWFMDQKDGITKQINTLSNMGLLSCFVGMLTDSRSFLSFTRHEYFRRILCNIFGEEIAKGELPNDIEWVGKIIEDICYKNAKSYFNY